MPLPDAIRESVAHALAEAGRDAAIRAVTPVSGGCINHGVRLETADGARWFLKWNARAPVGMFAAERDGLAALHDAARRVGAGLRVPVPLAVGEATAASPDNMAATSSSPRPPAWLLLEFIEPGRPSAQFDEILGRALATLHSANGGDTFGWRGPNWIGSLDQDNTPGSSWATFWRERRLSPQLDLARGRGRLHESVFDRLLELVPAAVDGVEVPSLLHGDLWSGNAYAAADGSAVVIDPAVYRGDGEVDLAMTELFGGFAERFYRAYDEVRPLTDAYRSHRRDLYQLYYLLVHVNLFGGSYAAAAVGAAERLVAALA